MNEVVTLTGKFTSIPRNSKGNNRTLPKGYCVTLKHLESLILDLEEILNYWRKHQTFFNGALIDVYYIKIAAKSNRIQEFITETHYKPNDSIVGAKFTSGNNKKHIITHFIALSTIEKTILKAKRALAVLKREFNGKITYFKKYEEITRIDQINFKKYYITKTSFINIIVDSCYVEKFEVPESNCNVKNQSIVSLYDLGDLPSILRKIGIRVTPDQLLNKNTIILDPFNLEILKQKAPYLISMATENLTELAPTDFDDYVENKKIEIPKPGNEPIVGVIDTLFSEEVYFHEWVEFHNLLSPDLVVDQKDYRHGTAVTSLIVDGPQLNPSLEDGCGRFRVRHFGVALHSGLNSVTVIRSIQNIIAENHDIHVWNLSLGSKNEINQNFISAQAAELDRIQFENDVIFVVAGTNKSGNKSLIEKIGAPADSINSLVVNSVAYDRKAASYSRKGPVLSQFIKPDVSYYGGTYPNYINVCEPFGLAKLGGTSFAAPWVTRKLAYLIEIIGLNKEEAKALIIDSARKWDNKKSREELITIGNGIVPKKIDDIINTPNNEIRFIISSKAKKFDTFNYQLPVPIHNDSYPFVARATLCYFPKCTRNQGVDYSNTELDIYLGRINDDGKIKAINHNVQSSDDYTQNEYVTEKEARVLFQKWQNVKQVSDEFTPRSRARKSYKSKLWGISIKKKERLNQKDGQGITFAVVVTLREINGENRFNEFIQQCLTKGWLVNRIDNKNQLKLYNASEQSIDLN